MNSCQNILPQIVLASASPRRKELLQQIGVQAHCMPVDIDESINENESASVYCQRLALEKAQKGWQVSAKNHPVLGADTIVVMDDEILGKPKDENHALSMLMALANRQHTVITAVAMVFQNKQKVVQSSSLVQFSAINEQDVNNYIKSGEPMDKAGSYGIQGYAARWIKHISGSYTGIMGLPLYETMQLIEQFSQNHE